MLTSVIKNVCSFYPDKGRYKSFANNLGRIINYIGKVTNSGSLWGEVGLSRTKFSLTKRLALPKSDIYEALERMEAEEVFLLNELVTVIDKAKNKWDETDWKYNPLIFNLTSLLPDIVNQAEWKIDDILRGVIDKMPMISNVHDNRIGRGPAVDGCLILFAGLAQIAVKREDLTLSSLLAEKTFLIDERGHNSYRNLLFEVALDHHAHSFKGEQIIEALAKPLFLRSDFGFSFITELEEKTREWIEKALVFAIVKNEHLESLIYLQRENPQDNIFIYFIKYLDLLNDSSQVQELKAKLLEMFERSLIYGKDKAQIKFDSAAALKKVIK